MLIYADNVALNRYKQKDLIHITICRRMGSTDAGHFYTILQLDLYKSLRKLPTLCSFYLIAKTSSLLSRTTLSYLHVQDKITKYYSKYVECEFVDQ